MTFASRKARRGMVDNGQSGSSPATTGVTRSLSEQKSPSSGRFPIERVSRNNRRFARVTGWDLWSKPGTFISFVLGWEVVAAVLLAVGIATAGPVTWLDWARFGALAACATVHIQLTRRQEERRRNRLKAVHIDLTGIWVFPAALLLPIQLTLLLILVVRGQRWINSRRPPHRFVFTSFTHAVSALLAQRFFVTFGSVEFVDLEPGQALRTFGLLVVAGLIYAGLQAIFIGMMLALGGTTQRTIKNVLGSATDNLLDAATIGLGIITTILLLHMPAALVILVLVSVLGNRLAEISQLQADAKTDTKTGLLNMRGWSEAAERAFTRSNRAGQGPALFMIDLDHFKWINDTYGHPAGDDVILQVGRLLSKAIRPSDIVGRFGGEEFVVLLVETDLAAAERAAERIRRAVAEMHLTTTGRHAAPVVITDRTTSIGVAVYPDHGETLEELLHAADTAVYEAKERGRDQVRFATGKPKPSEASRPIEVRHT